MTSTTMMVNKQINTDTNSYVTYEKMRIMNIKTFIWSINHFDSYASRQNIQIVKLYNRSFKHLENEEFH